MKKTMNDNTFNPVQERKELKNAVMKFNKYLSQFKHIIGLCVVIMLLTLIVLTVINFDKQNQIIETGGFIDGKVKCVCNQDAWDRFEEGNKPVNIISNISSIDG